MDGGLPPMDPPVLPAMHASLALAGLHMLVCSKDRAQALVLTLSPAAQGKDGGLFGRPGVRCLGVHRVKPRKTVCRGRPELLLLLPLDFPVGVPAALSGEMSTVGTGLHASLSVGSLSLDLLEEDAAAAEWTSTPLLGVHGRGQALALELGWRPMDAFGSRLLAAEDLEDIASAPPSPDQAGRLPVSRARFSSS